MFPEPPPVAVLAAPPWPKEPGLPVHEGGERPASVVCVLTGHGLKDPDTALGKAPSVTACENDLAAVEKAVFD